MKFMICTYTVYIYAFCITSLFMALFCLKTFTCLLFFQNKIHCHCHCNSLSWCVKINLHKVDCILRSSKVKYKNFKNLHDLSLWYYCYWKCQLLRQWETDRHETKRFVDENALKTAKRSIKLFSWACNNAWPCLSRWIFSIFPQKAIIS